jgi:hypothetical protein
VHGGDASLATMEMSTIEYARKDDMILLKHQNMYGGYPESSSVSMQSQSAAARY